MSMSRVDDNSFVLP